MQLILFVCILAFTNICANTNDSFHPLKIRDNMSENKAVLKAIYHLDMACNLAQRIEINDIKLTVLEELNSCKECLQNKIVSKNFEPEVKKFTILYENIDEILADCSNDDLRVDIPFYLEKAIEEISHEGNENK